MKKQMMAMAGALALAVGGLVAAPALNNAEAQSAQKAPVILIVDRAQLVTQSKAGKTIPDQAQKVRDNIAKELEALKADLEKDIADYQKNASLMSDEVRQKTEQELAMRQQYGLPQRAQIMDQAFSAVVDNARATILNEAAPIMKEVIEKRGATIMLDRSAVLYNAVETDVTQEVIAALDKKMSTVEVEKITLADVEKKLKEIAAKQQEAADAANKKKK